MQVDSVGGSKKSLNGKRRRTELRDEVPHFQTVKTALDGAQEDLKSDICPKRKRLM